MAYISILSVKQDKAEAGITDQPALDSETLSLQTQNKKMSFELHVLDLLCQDLGQSGGSLQVMLLGLTTNTVATGNPHYVPLT